MALPDYYDLVDPLLLPIRGKTYRIPPASALDVVRYQQYVDRVRSGEPLSDAERLTVGDVHRMFLGDALDEMQADGVLPHVIQHASTVAYIEAILGREKAEEAWSNVAPKAPTTAASSQNEPVKPKTTGSRRSSSTAAARRTP